MKRAVTAVGANVVYFIEAALREPLIKIGHSRDLSTRFATLATENAAPLTILGVIPHHAPGSLERELHRRFQVHHHHGEWFTAHTKLRRYIDVEAVSYAVPLTVAALHETNLDELAAQPELSSLLTVKELAEHLAISEVTVRRQVRQKLLPAIRVSKRTIRFDPDAAAIVKRRRAVELRANG